MRVPDKWIDPALGLTLRAWAVDPYNLDVVRCEIGQVIESDCSLTEGYYSDTRVSASICVLNPVYPAGSWVRLTVDDTDGGTEVIGTFAITETETEESAEGTVVTLTLHSSIWALTENRARYHWTIGEGASASSAISKVCESCGRPYMLMPGFVDWNNGASIVFEVEDPMSAVLFDICERSSNRMDVDGHGRITFSPYRPPSERGADWEIDERDSRSIVMDADLKETDSPGEAYSESIVVWKGRDEGETEDREVISWANIDTHAPLFVKQSGYTRSKVHNVTDMSPTTQARADQLAEKYLVEDSESKRTIERTVMWCPVHYGDIVHLTRLDGSTGNWLVQTADCDFGSWTKKLTLKEAS